ncbi:MAG TPA: toxin [Thermoanaerobaculia bacterium]|nr:toxin [Thermoanaerobaculia bacterium]
MATVSTQIGFHGLGDFAGLALTSAKGAENVEFTYTVENVFHPFLGELIEQLNKKSLPGLFDPKFQDGLAQDFFSAYYTAVSTNPLVKLKPSKKEIDVSDGGPYSVYNWELLFHIPLTIAVHLSKNQRFAEAQRWFHYIFDPTTNEKPDPSTPPQQRFWRFLRFRKETDVQQIGDLVAILSKPGNEDLKTRILSGYEAIKNKPFQPHAVARTRTLAYQYCVVMKYLDNLIAWGDSLFMQDTLESINDATQRYVLAANLLGPRPQRIPSQGTIAPKTFAQLKAQGLDAMGDALVELENKFPFNQALPRTQGGPAEAQSGPLFGIGHTLYFCIPQNENMLGYWDTVADRLFKIRHCMNIEGVVRQLALFDPPLDPGMLVKAAAAGINVGSIVNGLNQPIGPARSLFLIQKALELAGEVRGLGNALLSALEKRDGERLALLRQGHEIKIQELSREVRFLQWKQAQEATESLLRSRASALERYHYYERLLGLPADANAPDALPLDRRELTEENFDEAYSALVDQYNKDLAVQTFPNLKLAGGTSPAGQSGATGQGNLYLNVNENTDLNNHAPTARDYRIAATAVDDTFGVLALLPLFSLNIHFWGIGGKTDLAGGPIFAGVGHIISSSLNTKASDEESRGASASKTASFERRADDWLLQHNLAARELMQIGRQIISSLIAEQVAHHEFLNIQKQIDQTQEVDRFLHEKFTNEELYGWMQGEISRLYYEYYRFAFDTARKAERTMKYELMRPELDATDYVKPNYWDAGRKGLLSGEALYLDVKRMEMAFHDNNKRELELTRHVSLRQLDPLALLSLKVTGRCEATIPEWLYDRDCPGHYMRRIKSVALSLPAVVGPYTNVNCTLTLLRSTLRKSPLLKDDKYERKDANDDRFVDSFGSVQSIVTSGGVNDSGLFETNFRDERFLPFEGAGAESSWRLELPKDFRSFDYMAISDVILHVRYTARQGGDPAKVKGALDALFADSTLSNLALFFSLRHDFPTEWSAFANSTADLKVRLRKDHFPYLAQSRTLVIKALEVYGEKNGQVAKRTVPRTSPELVTLANELNGPSHASDQSFAADDVLTRDAAQVFLVVRYTL